jgi:hypothetical protein
MVIDVPAVDAMIDRQAIDRKCPIAAIDRSGGGLSIADQQGTGESGLPNLRRLNGNAATDGAGKPISRRQQISHQQRMCHPRWGCGQDDRKTLLGGNSGILLANGNLSTAMAD